MPTVTVRPDGYVQPAFVQVVDILPDDINDQSDSTYAQRSSAGTPMLVATMAYPSASVPSGADIVSIVPGMRARRYGASPIRLAIGVLENAGRVDPWHTPQLSLAPWYAPQIATGAIVDATQPVSGGLGAHANGAAWSQSQTIAIVADDLCAAGGDVARLYELLAVLYHSARPVINSVGAVGTDVGHYYYTSYPEVSVSVHALIESWQTGETATLSKSVEVEVRFYTSAQHGSPGFDPTVTVPLHMVTTTVELAYTGGTSDSYGVVLAGTGAACAVGGYYVYARARRTFANAGWCAQSDTYFSIDTEFVSPSFDTTLDAANQRVEISVTPTDPSETYYGTYAITNPVITVQRSSDGGTTWETVRGADKTAGQFGQESTLYDYEAPRGVALQYRTQVEGTCDGNQIATAWVTDSTGTMAASGWNLKCPEDPSLNWTGARVKLGDSTKTEDVAVFRAIGRTRPVVSSMSLGGWDGDVTLAASTSTERTLLDGLVDHQGVLYLQGPYGWERYVRIVSRSRSESGPAGAQVTRVKAGYVEMDVP